MVKFLLFKDFLFVVFSGKKQRKQVGKMPKITKINLEAMTTFFEKILAKYTNFEVSCLGLGLEFQVSSLGPGLGIFEVSVSKF